MQHFPIFLDLADRKVVIAGNGAFALAKLRLLLKTEARITLFAAAPEADLEATAAAHAVPLIRRAPEAADLEGAALAYGAHGEAGADARLARLARAAGVPVNVVDNLEGSDFITPP
jgi:uroporphyrinogen-III C-methyltransferase (EC 2.1.1.107)